MNSEKNPKKNICIILGAGFSMEQDLPNWNKLVNDVTKLYNVNIKVDEQNLIETMGLIEDDRINFIRDKLIEHGLPLENVHFFARRYISSAVRVCLKQSLVKNSFGEIKNKMQLGRAVAQSVYERVKNKLHTTIIIYNFDDYFEFSFKTILVEDNNVDKYNEWVFEADFDPQNFHLPSGEEEKLVSIYHVHGCIPIFDEVYGYNFYNCANKNPNISIEQSEYKAKKINIYQKKLNNGIVFSGNDYAELIDDIMVNWTDMIQYISYSQLPIAIIGFSLTDINFRKIIRRLKKFRDPLFEGNKIHIFWGYPKNVKSEYNNTDKKIAEYLFKGICSGDNLVQTSKQFGEDLSKEVIKFFEILLK